MSDADVIQAPAGLGKTTLVHEAIAELIGRRTEIYAPTHALAEEQARKIRATTPRLKIKVIAGRSHPGADGKPLCKKHRLAEEVANAGGEVLASLCAQKKGKSEERCQYYDTCPYIDQFKPTDVTIYTHAHLPQQRTRLEPGLPDFAVIDEAFFSSCISTFKVPLSLLRAPFLGPAGLHVGAKIERALTQAGTFFANLRSSGFEFERWQEALAELRVGAPSMNPKMGQTRRRAALRQIQQRTQMRDLLHAVLSETGGERRESHALKYCPTTQMITVHVKKSISRFHDQQRNEARVLIIDANANRDLISQFFNITSFTTIAADRKVEVFQCRTTRCSTTSLVPARNSDPKSKLEAKRRLKEVTGIIANCAKQHRRLLVVGPQSITGNPKSKVKPLIKVPPNVDLAHFGAIRGIDEWKDHDAIVVIGRNEPPIEGVETTARCLFLTDRAPLQFSENWTTEERGYRLKRGLFGVDVVRHPDSRMQAILQQQREGETEQAIDRLRLVHAQTPKRAYVLSSVVLNIDVDHLLTWDEMVNGGGRIEQAWNTLPGVIPLAPAWLAAQFPRLWKSVDAAKQDAAEAFKECRFTNIYSISNAALFQHQYRPASASQRAWSKCLSCDASPEITRAALVALLGFDVEMRASKPPAAPRLPRRARRTKH